MAQQVIKIPAPTIELKGNIIYISYDILNSLPSESFEILLEVKDSEGNIIDARTLTGDVGRSVSGGKNKSIQWDLEADELILNTMIFVNIYAEKVVVEPQGIQTKTDENFTPENRLQGYSRTSLILQSVAVPGLGLTRVTGNPHWIKGVTAYGCLGGAIVLNRMAISTYDDFLSAETPEDADALYSKSSTQDVISETMVYVAIGIWVIDLVWTFIGTKPKGDGLASRNGISVGGGIDKMTGVPQFQMTYRF